MRWGDTQNLLSVVIGLNLAYAAFKEIRMPYLTSVQRGFEILQNDMTLRGQWLETMRASMPDGVKLGARFLVLRWDVMHTDAEMKQMTWYIASQKFENYFGIPSMLVACIGIGCLIFSSINYESQLRLRWFWLITIVGLAPVTVHIAWNYLAIWAFYGRYGIKLKSFRDRYSAIIKDAESQASGPFVSPTSRETSENLRGLPGPVSAPFRHHDMHDNGVIYGNYDGIANVIHEGKIRAPLAAMELIGRVQRQKA